jgi:hypothetical protein
MVKTILGLTQIMGQRFAKNSNPIHGSLIHQGISDIEGSEHENIVNLMHLSYKVLLICNHKFINLQI